MHWPNAFRSGRVLAHTWGLGHFYAIYAAMLSRVKGKWSQSICINWRAVNSKRARASHPMCSHLISLTIHAYIDISKLNLKLYSTYWANASKYPMFHAFYRTVSAGAVLYVCVSIQRSHRHDLWGFAPIYSPGRPCLRRWRSLPSSFPLINDHHPDTYTHTNQYAHSARHFGARGKCANANRLQSRDMHSRTQISCFG